MDAVRRRSCPGLPPPILANIGTGRLRLGKRRGHFPYAKQSELDAGKHQNTAMMEILAKNLSQILLQPLSALVSEKRVGLVLSFTSDV